MQDFNDHLITDIPLYTYGREIKQKFFLKRILHLFDHHINYCPSFNRMMMSIKFEKNSIKSIKDLPYIPVRLFKLFELFSIPENEVIKTMTSSGTTGTLVSKIFLDKQTSSSQTRVLSRIVSTFLGVKRAPMIIIDAESTVKNRNIFSARAAGITGFSIFASSKIYALNDDMTLNINGIKEFINVNAERTIFIFGFTFIIYEHFYRELLKSKESIDLSNAVLIHGGGWKKLISNAVDNNTFKRNLNAVCNLNRIHDYYGMVEQTGSIHLECEMGYLHTSEYSDIIVRDPNDFSVKRNGDEGIIQLLSLIPESYPGHSILTEDVGIIYGEDNCSCGRKGKYFKINGRLKSAEIRGCSDTYGENYTRD